MIRMSISVSDDMGQRSNGGGEVEARTCCIELGLFGKGCCYDFWKDAVRRDVNGASFFRSFPALLRRTTVTKSIYKSLAHEDTARNGCSDIIQQGLALARDRGHGVSVSFHKVINPIRVQAL